MASSVVMSSSSLLDSSGLPRERSALTMDLHRLNLLLQASSQVQLKLKGKNISNSILVPLSGTVDASEVPAIACDSRVLSPADLGISSTLEPFASKTVHVNSSVMQIPNEILAIGKKKFSLCLVAQFMGKPPKFGLIQAMARKLCSYGAISVAYYKDDLYLFQFPSDFALSRALFRGPWHIGGILLLLRKWDANIEPVDFSTSIIPVWVHLSRVPMELLTKEASVLTSIPSLFSRNRTIDVAYSLKPQLCALCNAWGHHSMACALKKPSVQWVPNA
ncbi:hypothetical protein Tsubulata_007159 [Turnera subulata]|uniref:DUF4283 domain-containing protein n=1 Tax=Turnera subulata TaxID=218843 RepID=A0A9Q0FC82_9ROSI|nr:hypothetical protein Tsubulata_007159 [Turnera subulata]